MKGISQRFGRNILYRGQRVFIQVPEHNGFFRAAFYFGGWKEAYSNLLLDYDRPDIGMIEGKIPENSTDILVDNTGRLSAESLAAHQFSGCQYAWYKRHRLWISPVSSSSLETYRTANYKLADGETVDLSPDWTAHAVKVGELLYHIKIPESEFCELIFEEEQVWKLAFYRGFWALVQTSKDKTFSITVVVPEAAQYESMDWLIASFEQTSFDVFKGTIPVSDPDLYIDDLGIIREDLLTKTFPVDWREATYKGVPVKVGAHSDTHHFATHHADILRPRGVLPEFLSAVPAIQTGPQDFMAKIESGDSDLHLEANS